MSRVTNLPATTGEAVMSRIRLLLASAIFLAVGPTVYAADKAEQIESLMRYCHENAMFNGVVLVKEEGRTIYEKAWGQADLRDGRALDVDSAFYLASVSKQFAAMAAMLLVEQGKLRYDTKLSELFPEFPDYAAEVTVHHLLTHTSGVPDHFRVLGEVPDDLTNEQVLEALVAVPELDFEPGSRYSYSNGGYVLLSMIAARASGRPYHQFMAEEVFEPLGMDRTLVYDASKPKIENRAAGFTPAGELDDYRILTTGAGGMYSTVGDLSIWDDALYSGRLVESETLERAFSVTALSDGEQSDYGYGWRILETDGRKVVAHTGGLGGYRTFIGRDLERRNTVILLTNMGDTMNFGQLRDAITAILEGDEPAMPQIPMVTHLAKLVDQHGLAAALVAHDEICASSQDRYDCGEAQLNVLGYRFLARGEVDTAIVFFKKNVEAYPEAFNVYDSLGEAYMAKSMKREAIVNYARSLVINPDNENAIRMLERLRNMETVAGRLPHD